MDEGVARLTELGRRRRRLLAQLTATEDEIRPLIELAREAGLSLDEIGARIGLRRLAVAKWQRQAADS